MYKKCKVINLVNHTSKGKKGDILWFHPQGKLKIYELAEIDIIPAWMVTNLYILSDDEIKEGDWACHRNITNDKYQIIQCTKSNKESIQEHWKKIIATTDSSLIIGWNKHGTDLRGETLPSPSQSFIEKYVESYNKGKVIEEVLVEYESEIYGYGTITSVPLKSDKLILKINSKDNTITIRKIKDSWTRDEVEKLCRAARDSMCEVDIDTWIEKNL